MNFNRLHIHFVIKILDFSAFQKHLNTLNVCLLQRCVKCRTRVGKYFSRLCVFLVFLWDWYSVYAFHWLTRQEGSDLDPHAHTYASLTPQMGETLVMTYNPTLPSLSTHPES